MAGLVPAINVLLDDRKNDVDARAARGHDEDGFFPLQKTLRPPLK
jgi:hypothetical protein